MCCNDIFLEQLKVLNGVYDKLNETFFESALSKCVITIQRDTTGKILGWFTPREAWQAGEEKSPEINMTANFLDRPPLEIIATLLHEMCHQFAYQHDIKDTSRTGGYHNKEYKKIAEAHGLEVFKTPQHGFNHTKLTEGSRPQT